MVKKQKVKVKISLNNKFYSKEAVKEALNDFKKVCKGRILNNNMEVELESKEKISLLEEEFCNYVLGLMKNKF